MKLWARRPVGVYRHHDECPCVLERRRVSEAEARWREHNRVSYLRGCPCGAPSAVVQRHHEVLGSVPFEVWTCAEHAGMSGWSRTGDGPIEFHYDHDAPCPWGKPRGSSGPIGGPPTQWTCPHRTHVVDTHQSPTGLKAAALDKGLDTPLE